MSGPKTLRVDAFYCAAAGLILVLLSMPLASLLHTRPLLLVAAGLAGIAWAAYLEQLARAAAWRRPVAIVAGGNLLAAAGLAGLALLAPTLAGGLLLAAVALEVAGIGAAQIAALRR